MFACFLCFGRLIGIGQPIAAGFQASKRGAVRAGRVQSRLEECRPVVRGDGIQNFREIFKTVRLHLRRPAGRAVEGAAKVIDGFSSLTLLADDRVGFKPDQQTLIIKVDAPAQRLPVGSRGIQQLRGHGGIGQRAPFPTRAIIESGRVEGQSLPVLRRRDEAAAGGQHPTQIFRQSFVHPQQIPFHRLLVVRRGQALRPAVLAIP